MQGKRVDQQSDNVDAWPFPTLKPGEYGKGTNGRWVCMVPKTLSDGDGMIGDLGQHKVVEHEDGTITVFPSILVRRREDEVWHGFLERGVWREC